MGCGGALENRKIVGYRAAQTLERLINGETLDEPMIEIDLHTLHPRLSSELIAIDDPALLKALKRLLADFICKSPFCLRALNVSCLGSLRQEAISFRSRGCSQLGFSERKNSISPPARVGANAR